MAPGGPRGRGGAPDGRGSSRPARRAVPAAWQHPFLNVFRHFRVDERERARKEGDVASVMDRTLRRTVYRIRGAVPARNYIQLPRTSAQSLGLTGRYLYLLFRPLPAKHFVIHLDVATQDSQIIRVSLSSLFRELRCTATWLHLPLTCEIPTSRAGDGGGLGQATCSQKGAGAARNGAGQARPGSRWTCLQLDLQGLLQLHLHRDYGHLKGVRLCASLLAGGLYTSNLCFDPEPNSAAVTVAEARRAALPVAPVPREMAFPVPSGERWHDLYLHVRFPSHGPDAPSQPAPESHSRPETGSLPGAALPGQGCPPLPRPAACIQPGLACAAQGPCPSAPPSGKQSGQAAAPGRDSSQPRVSGARCEAGTPGGPGPASLGDDASRPRQRPLPDPALRLQGVIGFGGHSTKWALWTRDGAAVLYPCHALVVELCVHTRQQRFFLGHTDKVSALALDVSGSLLASVQAGPPGMLRLWDPHTRQCLCLLRSPAHSVGSLSFSHSGALLCGVGRDRHGKTVVVAWDVAPVRRGGEPVVLAKVHADVDIQAFEVARFDETRMASCGRGGVRLWRLRGGALRSCAVDLGEHHTLDFTGLAFGCTQGRHTLYVCSRSGHILEVDPQRMAVRLARRLLPTPAPGSPSPRKQAFSSGPGIPISSLSVSESACAVGSEDGRLRLWSLDFSSVLLEAEHEGPVSSVRVSPDARRVLSTTSSGHLGFLDIPTQEYSVLMRSHTAPVLGLATEGSHGQLATVSQDLTVRVWDLESRQQLFDFTSPEEPPTAVAFHPTQPFVFCGFSSGAMRPFSLEAPQVLAEHRCHSGAVTGLVVTPNGNFLFSSCSRGTLAQYCSATPPGRVLRVAAGVVCQDSCPSPNTLAVSGDSRLLAFVGPSKNTVTVVDTASLDKLLRVDISTLDLAGGHLDLAAAVCFSPASPTHLLVSTASPRVLVLDATSGCVVREVSREPRLSGWTPGPGLPEAAPPWPRSALLQLSGPPGPCSTLALSEDSRLLLTAAGRALHVWDLAPQAPSRGQVFVGHSEPVRAVAFAPGRRALSAGDAVFLWDVLAPPSEAGGGQGQDVLPAASGPPRRRAPCGDGQTGPGRALRGRGPPAAPPP
ncbi:WD repeat-containing protein 90 [Talpa occidentalis]|uniref:WD repeat-containing protein 90 n=1 Tax=Talpa occidentalis TaxID=50954 RepID=UPI0018904B36|nr:WD repeat-containing protein 90 [Talpa occidentalis]